jgi:predicted xylan-binding protein with Ca-dependent carbohydrate-binding module
MRRRLAAMLPIVACTFVACTKAPPAVLTLTPAKMATITGWPQPDGAVALWTNGTLQSKVYVERGPITITVRALGHQTGGQWPMLVVDLDGQVLSTLVIDSGTLKDFSFTTKAEKTGTAVLGLSFTNHVPGPTPIEGRNLRIQLITITQAT